MTLPTGQISMSQVNTELGKSATAQISINDADVRALASKSSGQISMDDLRGKSAENVYESSNLKVWLDAGKSSSYSGSGTTWENLADTNDATLYNGVGYSSSDGGYLSFDGSNDHAVISETGSINAPISKNMTISIWLYITKSWSWQGVFNKDRSINKQWGLFLSSSNRFVFGVDGSNLNGSSFSLNTWYNVTLVQAANSSRKIYVNGSLDVTQTSSFGTNNNGGQNWGIGYATGVSENFGGRISQVLLYENEALTSSQVSQNFNALKARYGIS